MDAAVVTELVGSADDVAVVVAEDCVGRVFDVDPELVFSGVEVDT